MTTTAAWLQTKDAVDLAFTLVFEGYNLAYTTTDDTSGMTTAYAATDWTVFKAGLFLPSPIEQRIEIFEPRIDPDSVTFRILDHDDTLGDTMLREAGSDVTETYLTADLAANATTITVDDTSDFASTGHVYIGGEAIQYTGKTGTTFTGCTRGKWSIFAVNGGTRFGMPHMLDRNVTEGAAFAPQVMSRPKTWYNRRVALYVHHKESGAWSTKANAHLLWAGRIKNYSDPGDGTIAITATSIKETLLSNAFRDQWSADLGKGIYFDDAQSGFQLVVTDGVSITETLNGTISGTGAVRTWEELVTNINTLMQTERNPALGYDYSLALNGDALLEFTVGKSTAWTGDHSVTVSMSPLVAFVLGFNKTIVEDGFWSPDGLRLTDATGTWHDATDTGPMDATAPWPPLVYSGVPIEGSVLNVAAEMGTWANQPTLPPHVSELAEGVLKFGEVFRAAKYDTTTVTVYETVYQSVRIGEFEDLSVGGKLGELDYREGGDYDPPRTTQVWYNKGPAGTMLLQLLLSTGATGYNHATYDVLPLAVGMALPATMVDIPSFEALNLDVPEYHVVLDGPTPIRELIESIGAITNRYLVFKNGKLALVKPAFESGVLPSATSLTEDNKADVADRVRVDVAAEGILNKLTLKYRRNTLTGEWEAEETIVSQRSVTDFDQARGATINGYGIEDARYWTETAATALAYFSRPIAVYERTFNYNLIAVTPGQAVLLTDGYTRDPVTGNRGVTNMPGWVLGTSFDWLSGKGRIEVAFLREQPPDRFKPWAPSALVSSYNAGTKTLTCAAHTFSESTGDVDPSHFDVSDAVAVIKLDATGSPTRFTSTVASQSGNDVTLVDDFASYSASDTYALEFSDIATVQASQLNFAFIADDGTMTTAVGVPYRWGTDADLDSIDPGSVAYTTEFMRWPDRADDTNEPLSVHKAWYLAESANALYGNCTRNHPVQVAYTPDNVTAVSGTTTLVWGPLPVPIYGHPTRTFTARVYGKVDDASFKAYFRICTAATPIAGTSYTALTYPAAYNATAWGSTQSTDLVFLDAMTVTPIPFGSGPPQTWLWVEGKSDSGHTATFRGVEVVESAL